MSDLVKRLRDTECPAGCGSMKFCVCAYAADAGDYIEKLEAQLAAADRLASEVDTFCDERCIHSTDGIYACAAEYFEARK